MTYEETHLHIFYSINLFRMATYNASSTKVIYSGTQIVWFILGVIEIILALRFFLKLLGAASAPFTNIIYSLSYPLVGPFVAVFPTTSATGALFEWTTILAGVIYALLAYGIMNLFFMGLDVSTSEAAVRLREQE